MAAADKVIMTVNPQLLTMMGLQDFLKTVKKTKSRFNEKVVSQGRLNDILHEIEEIGTRGHDVHKSRSRDDIREEYGMTGRKNARYMRVDKLIRSLKDRLDAGELTLTAAVELSYLPEDE